MQGLYFNGKQLFFRRDLPMPHRAPGEALVAVHQAGICGTDLEVLAGYANFRGIPGHEFVGHVVEADDNKWIGKRVVGEINIGCGQCDYCRRGIPEHCRQRKALGIRGHDGVFAEYVTVPEVNLHQVPAGISDEQAVFTEPLAAAFRPLEQVQVRPEMQVAVLGTGKLGSLVAQVMATTGATVFALSHHLERVRFLTERGIRVMLPSGAKPATFDVVVEVTGSQAGLGQALQLVRPLGTVILKSTTHSGAPSNWTAAVVNEITLVGSRCGPFARALQALLKREVDVVPIIDAVYPLSDGLVAFEAAHRRGAMKILLQMESG